MTESCQEHLTTAQAIITTLWMFGFLTVIFFGIDRLAESEWFFSRNRRLMRKRDRWVKVRARQLEVENCNKMSWFDAHNQALEEFCAKHAAGEL